MSDARVILVADLHGLVGRDGELRALLADLAAASRAEAGCMGFRVLDGEDAGELVLLSSYLDEAALRAHYATPHYRRYRDQVGPLLARPSDVVIHHVSRIVRALDPNPPDPGLLG